MKRARVIPVLGIDNRKMVKTIRYKKPKYLGDPINAIKIFNEKEVDEICIADIRASARGSEPDYDHIYEMAGEAFMPMAYGGGIHTFDQARKVFECGVEKVIINSGCYKRMALIDEIADTYGGQSVMVSLDIKKGLFGDPVPRYFSGKKKGKGSLSDVIGAIDRSNAGEALLQNIDRDGTFQGYDLELINYVSSRLSIPLVASGGAGSLDDFLLAVKSGASAVAAASYFSYKNNNTDSILINYPQQAELKEKIFLNLP